MTEVPETESSGIFHVLRRGSSVRTKPAQRVPGSPAPYMPSPLHPVNDADIQAVVDRETKAKPFGNYGDVIAHAAEHNLTITVQGLRTMQGVPRHEHFEFWSIARPWGSDKLHRQFFYMHHVTGVEIYEDV